MMIHDFVRGSWMAGFVKGMMPPDWTLVTNHTAKELIWGYQDPVLTKVKAFKSSITEYFGYFLGQNGTDSKTYGVLDGSSDIRNLARIVSWNEKPNLAPIWSSDSANGIKGTDGNSFPPLLEKNELAYVFVDSMCRSIFFTAEEQSVMLGPVETWKYILPGEVFQSAELNVDNRGYCPDGYCLPSGVLNISSCYKETFDIAVPFVMSQPHLLNADKSISSVLEGLSPNDELHGTRLFVEPITGLLLGAEKNLQINIHLRSVHLEEGGASQTVLSKYPKGIFIPAHWISQRFTASPPILSYVSNNVVSMLSLVQQFPLIILAIAVVGTLIAFIIGVRIHLSEDKDNDYVRGNKGNSQAQYIKT